MIATEANTNALQFGVMPAEPNRHTAQADVFSTGSQSTSIRTESEQIRDFIVDWTITTNAQDQQIQDGDKNKAKLGVTNTMPELIWYAALDFTRNPSPIDLATDAAKICTNLIVELKEIESHYKDQSKYDRYQIILHRVSKNSLLYRLFLRVNALSWYNKEKRNGNGKRIKRQAKYYITQFKTNKSEHVEFSSNFQRSNVVKTYFCDKKFCDFFVEKSHCIYENKNFYAVVRSNGYQIITLCPIKHSNNKDWVQTPAAWMAALEVLEYIQSTLGLNTSPLCQIFINFGNWQSQIKNDQSDGHAHMNIILTPEATEACKNVNGNLKYLGSATIPSENYRQSDAIALKQELKKKKMKNLSIIDKFGEEETSSNY